MIRLTLELYGSPSRVLVAEATGDTMRRALSNLADHPGVRDCEQASYDMTIDFYEPEEE